MKTIHLIALVGVLVVSCADPSPDVSTPIDTDTDGSLPLIPVETPDITDATDSEVEDSQDDTNDGTVILPDGIPGPDAAPDVSPDVQEDTFQDTTDTEKTDCADNNKCTIDLFDDELGECVYYPVGCFDDLVCTVDMCDPIEGCKFPLDLDQPGCCVEEEDCDDGDGCTIDACEDTGCVHVVDPNPACCFLDTDCDDGDPCTEDLCGEDGCSHLPIGAPACCALHGDCDDGDECTWDQCTPTGCTYTDQCCSTHEDCSPGDDPCTVVQCIEGTCVQSLNEEGGNCCTPGPLWDDSVSPPMLTHTTPFHTWNEEAQEDSTTWVYKSTEDWNLLDASPHAATFTVGPLSLPGGVVSELTMDILPGIQMESGVDHLVISVGSDEDGFHPIWTKENLNESGWQTIQFKLSAWANQSVYLKVAYDSVTADSSASDEIQIANLSITSDCEAMACGADACDDGILTTEDICVGSLCSVTLALGVCDPISSPCGEGSLCTDHPCEALFCTEKVTPGCCEDDEDCNDGNPCTADVCGSVSPNVCAHSTNPECCTEDGDCEDGDPCTTDFCHPTSGCLTTWVESCCQEHAECGDENPCTTDSCASGSCIQEPSCCVQDSDCLLDEQPCLKGGCVEGSCKQQIELGPSCCGQLVFMDSLDSLSSIQNWAVIEDSDATDEVNWGIQGQFVQSPPYALYYGNPLSWSYETGMKGNHGTLRSPEFHGTAGQPLWVMFELYLANEFASGGFANADFDRLKVEIVSPEEEVFTLWESSQLEPQWWDVSEEGEPIGPKWTTIGPLLLPHQAKGTWSLQFTFNTIDGSANQHVGAIIDDISVYQACDLTLP